MVNIPTLIRYLANRKKFVLVSLCLISAYLYWIAVLHFIRYKQESIKNDTKKDSTELELEELRVNRSPIKWDKNVYYIAAVIEYEALQWGDVIGTWTINIQNFIHIIAECSKHKVDIVVFPEGGIHGYLPYSRITALLISSYVPSSNASIIPCFHKDYKENVLRNFSCAARKSNIYVAVNLIEKERSYKSFTLDGHLLYITEVVFDRKGRMIAKYRKTHLYTERWGYEISSPDEPEMVTFNTDFGVQFGLMVCFDIFFKEPAFELVNKRNITHIIHSSSMMTRLPFLAASSVELGWSYALDVVLLSSSSPNPKYTIASNIYFGRRLGAKTYVKPFQRSNIIIAPVPKNRRHTNVLYPNEYNSLERYLPGKFRQTSFLVEHVTDRFTTKPLTMANAAGANFTYKSATFECNITASWEHFGFVPNYQFVAYSGLNNYSVATINAYAEICGITLCSNTSNSSCQQPPNFEDASKLVFKSLNISTRSTIVDPVRIPAAFDANLVALDGTKFYFDGRLENHLGGSVNRVRMRLRKAAVNLQTFSVYKFGTNATPMSYFNYYDNMMNLDVIT